YSGSGTPEDPYIVTWLPVDPECPQQYSEALRWSLTFLVSCLTLCMALASSAYSGAVSHLITQFHCSEEVAILGVSLMVLGYAIGPLVWAPMSETFGRRQVFLWSYVVYTMWTAVCAAAQNIETLIVFRLLAGMFGSSALVIPAGQIADMFTSEKRGLGIGLFCTAPFLGPALGPVIGGFLGDSGHDGWRWVMGFLAIFAGVLTALGFLFLPETYSAALLRKRAKLLSKVTNQTYLTQADADHPVVIKEVVRNALFRPWVLLFREPIVLSLTIYMSVIYGTLYLCFSAFPIVYQVKRGWSSGIGGLAFMGIMVGFLAGCAYICWDNGHYAKISRANNGWAPPECRLPSAIGGGVAIMVGLAWFAATNGAGVHWAASVCAGVPFGFGFILVFISCANYLIDSYTRFAASVLAANSIVRSLFGAIFPLFTTYMFENLGIHWASAVPGFIALACFPFPILFYIYGAKIRSKCKYASMAAAGM
ncbi:hypothetical protein DOTSEDRAFT_117678, partial [Dothistroma septosporum NZE10]